MKKDLVIQKLVKIAKVQQILLKKLAGNNYVNRDNLNYGEDLQYGDYETELDAARKNCYNAYAAFHESEANLYHEGGEYFQKIYDSNKENWESAVRIWKQLSDAPVPTNDPKYK